MKLSSYTIAANCTDITDLKDGIEEVRATICKYREEGKLIPSYFYVRLSKLEKKLIKFQKKDMNKKKNDIRVHVNPKYLGNRLYVFTKDSKHCIAVEYNPAHDFGKGSPSGARIESVEIHTNNGFVFNEEWKEISLSEIPECILELLIYLK